MTYEIEFITLNVAPFFRSIIRLDIGKNFPEEFHCPSLQLWGYRLAPHEVDKDENGYYLLAEFDGHSWDEVKKKAEGEILDACKVLEMAKTVYLKAQAVEASKPEPIRGEIVIGNR